MTTCMRAMVCSHVWRISCRRCNNYIGTSQCRNRLRINISTSRIIYQRIFVTGMTQDIIRITSPDDSALPRPSSSSSFSSTLDHKSQMFFFTNSHRERYWLSIMNITGLDIRWIYPKPCISNGLLIGHDHPILEPRCICQIHNVVCLKAFPCAIR
jgi:hypothetical protein